jgi:hypothetical protein
VNYTAWVEPYHVEVTNPNHHLKTHRRLSRLTNPTTTQNSQQIFYHDAATGQATSIGKTPYPAMTLPPFATHALSENGTFDNVPKALMQESMQKGGVSTMSIHMVARTRAQAFGASLPRLPAWFDMRCHYANHWGAAPQDTQCSVRLRPLWARIA